MASFLSRARPRRPAAPWPGVVVVGGGKGGVGTSTTAALLAVASARLGVSTLLVEAVHGPSVLPLLMGRADPGPGLLTRDAPDEVEELQLSMAPGLTLLPGGGSPEDLAGLRQGERAARIRRASSLYDRHGMTVVDAGCRLDEVLGVLSTGAERLALVSSDSPVSLASSYALLKSVLLRQRTGRVELVVNRTGEEEGHAAWDLAAQAARGFLDHELVHAGTLPADPALVEAVSGGGGLHALDDDAPALRAAAAVVQRWHGEQARARRGGADVLPLAASG